MKDAEKTIGNMIDKQTVSFIASIDEDGFPNMKAMLQPRKYNPQIEMFARFKMKSSFHKTKRII